jgi:hypothetical protein
MSSKGHISTYASTPHTAGPGPRERLSRSSQGPYIAPRHLPTRRTHAMHIHTSATDTKPAFPFSPYPASLRRVTLPDPPSDHINITTLRFPVHLLSHTHDVLHALDLHKPNPLDPPLRPHSHPPVLKPSYPTPKPSRFLNHSAQSLAPLSRLKQH